MTDFVRQSLESLAASVDYGLTASARADAVGPRFLRITDIQEDRVDWEQVPFCEATATDESACRLEPGDVVFARTGATTGKSFLVRACPDRAVFASYLIRVRPDRTHVEPRYLAWYFQTPDYWRQISSSASGTAQPGVNASKLKALSVPVPALDEQRHIADILDKADAIRRKRKQAIAFTEELLRSAFLEMFGDPVTNPKRWDARPLGKLLEMPLRNGLSPASGGSHSARVLTLAAITRGAWDSSATKEGTFAVEPWADVRVDADDFLICRGNGNLALVGAGQFPISSEPGTVFPDTMIAARINRRALQREFLAALWRSSFVRRQIEASARTTNGTFKINQTAVENIRLLLPPTTLQERFGAFAERTRKLRSRLDDETTDNLFAALAQRAFRGELGSA